MDQQGWTCRKRGWESLCVSALSSTSSRDCWTEFQVELLIAVPLILVCHLYNLLFELLPEGTFQLKENGRNIWDVYPWKVNTFYNKYWKAEAVMEKKTTSPGHCSIRSLSWMLYSHRRIILFTFTISFLIHKSCSDDDDIGFRWWLGF